MMELSPAPERNEEEEEIREDIAFKNEVSSDGTRLTAMAEAFDRREEEEARVAREDRLAEERAVEEDIAFKNGSEEEREIAGRLRKRRDRAAEEEEKLRKENERENSR